VVGKNLTLDLADILTLKRSSESRRGRDTDSESSPFLDLSLEKETRMRREGDTGASKPDATRQEGYHRL